MPATRGPEYVNIGNQQTPDSLFLTIKFVNKLLARTATCYFLALASPVFAGHEVTEIPITDWPTGNAALGGGLNIRQNPYKAAGSVSNWQMDVVPLLLYNGKYVFSHGTSAGVHILNRKGVQLNLLARARFDGLDPGSSEFYEGIAVREQSLDGGVELRLRGDWGEFKTAWLTDTLDRHKGESAEVSYRYDLDFERLLISPFVNWEWRDEDMTNYYYGVSADEARPDRPEYTPGGSQWFSFGLNTSYELTDRVMLFGNAGISRVDSVVRNSPLVNASSVSSIYLGGTYLFGNLIEPVSSFSPERASEWSWRVNYGYQANGNIVSEIDQGDFSSSDSAETTIGGIMFGKLLADGRQADYIGRVAIYRHFEGNEGNGTFNSYAAYLMTMGRGYGAWSGEEWFRWGFGFGLSFADKVPIVEQRKQADKGEKTSPFLSYLEMQIDFPLRRLFKAKSVRNCYAGITLVHRSGIFGSSDLLGDVSGGSDWITAHLDCVRK
jgi:outer membrane scaffolding protein for murein synthesis (MipA/OmpV family)